MKDKRLNIRVDEIFLNELEKISISESEKNGFKVSQANIIRKAIKEFVERNK